MTQYLLSVHGSEDSPYATEEDMQRAFADVDRLNAEMLASGAWVFAGGLQPASTASVVRVRDGAIDRTDGPYLESKEHIGGFWVIEAADDAAAIAWAERATVACQGAVEVRPFQEMPS
ncbi:MAG TPA: YciI family protein [Candidatus Angelobacter sp.]|nr:YciI family protein [Candidatus Angelobacter sp.]